MVYFGGPFGPPLKQNARFRKSHPQNTWFLNENGAPDPPVGVESAATHRRHNTHTDNTERTHKENAPTKNKENPKNAHGENTHTHTHTAPKE